MLLDLLRTRNKSLQGICRGNNPKEYISNRRNCLVQNIHGQEMEEVLQKLQNAARIKLAIQSAPNFTTSVALYCAGFDIKEATRNIHLGQTEIMIKSSLREEIQHIPLDINNPSAGNQNLIERACILKSITKRMPKAAEYIAGADINLETIKTSNTLTNICRWAGFPEEHLDASKTRKVYKQVSIFANEFNKKISDPMIATSKESVPSKYLFFELFKLYYVVAYIILHPVNIRFHSRGRKKCNVTP